MSIVNVDTLEISDLKAAVKSSESSSPTLVLTGSADIDESARLGRVLRQLHDELLRVSANEVLVDFRELEFMNSSCFKEFVSWLASLEDVDVEKRYRIRFQSNTQKHWQRRSLAALGHFASDLVTIET